jgi:hypothetical protein
MSSEVAIVDALEQNFDDLELLDVYAEGIAPRRSATDALATISAGKKVNNIPQVSRDGSIILHDPEGRAQGLQAALAANSYKTLTIAFAFNDPQLFIQQRFAEYSASKLLAYGDHTGLTVIKEDGVRHWLEGGSPAYKEYLKRPGVKVNVSVYFNLARWEPQPEMYFPDGFGFYRLRFTSRNSLQNLKATLNMIRQFSRGLIAGIPLNLQLVNREVADPKGSRRTVPVWTFTMKPPSTLTLNSSNLQRMLKAGIEVGTQLQLPAPAGESLEMALMEPAPEDLESLELEIPQGVVERLESGYNPDPWRTKYFAITEGTPYQQKPGRAWLLLAATDNSTDSLSTALGWNSDEAMDAICRYADSKASEWLTLMALIEQAVFATAERFKKSAQEVRVRAGLVEGEHDPAKLKTVLEKLEAALAKEKGA